MADNGVLHLEGLPANVATVLSGFLAAVKAAYSADLRSVVLYGSAAEGKLTSTSDINLLLVLRAFSRDKSDAIRDSFLAAQAAINLQAMFLLEDEVLSASELFAQKFTDILRRRKVVFGEDPFSSIKIERADKIFRLRQVLLNLALRLRAAYVARSQRAEQVTHLLAETAGPLRAASATLLELEGAGVADANAALESVAASLNGQGREVVAEILAARSGGVSADRSAEVLFQVIELIKRISDRAARLA
jgi:predicted nucleotidyltransferase